MMSKYTEEQLAAGLVELARIEARENNLTLEEWYEVNEYRVMCDAKNQKIVGETSFATALRSYSGIQDFMSRFINE
jgi:hypothetical protein